MLLGERGQVLRLHRWGGGSKMRFPRIRGSAHVSRRFSTKAPLREAW